MNWKFWQKAPKPAPSGAVEKVYPAYKAVVEAATKKPVEVIKPRMNPDVKAKWVAALRSGDYTQGFGTLKQRPAHKRTTWCVYGVLAELAVNEGIIPAPKRRVWDGTFEFEGRSGMFLPDAVIKWAGLDKIPYTHRVTYNGREGLVTLNDLAEVPFSKLADLIEEQL